MKRVFRILPVLMIMAAAVMACTVTAQNLLPRLDAALASDEQALDGEGTQGAVETLPPAIDSFTVDTADDLAVGDTLTASWDAVGGEVRLCLAQVAEEGVERCFDALPATGSLGVRIDDALTGPLVMRLSVAPGQPDAVTESVELGDVCAYHWFTEPEVEGCPGTPIYETNAAAQPFEDGWLLWVDEPGRYFVLTDTVVEPEVEGKRYVATSDPLEITQDTSESVEPPEGLYAPVSGFGLIWRGDASGTGYRELLGWGRMPEFGYRARYQCDAQDQPTCYVLHPDGWVIVLHPEGYWYPAEGGRDYRLP